MTEDEAQHTARPGNRYPGSPAYIPNRIHLTMLVSTLFTAEMVSARFGGTVADNRRELHRLVREGVLAKRSQRRGVDFYHKKSWT